MKVNRFGNIPNNNPYKNQMNRQNEQLSQQMKQDKIQISKEALEMQKSNAQSSERLEKVERLKSEIDSGEYKVQPEKVAKNFFDFWTKS
ncbi:flagellar biosynthesis anti-sigma factor FlgM [Alkalihalobacillus sp. AL-G]|uniref:flagellar biosynthesis anti-sigma factor FlgM n=1 Tax=Alkalihalobacillus sp. AL-G TaxID=2926399 RepID=UPI00272AA763|nr:flagellar biosynthesis anti-sigma factor FlgM [Alkalihalobacillus sp. AL-G]WLD92977.1 flagellar biosynthesis anti-sigma factor FlgM [Alkalihalobacillus sp. AL-G]